MKTQDTLGRKHPCCGGVYEHTADCKEYWPGGLRRSKIEVVDSDDPSGLKWLAVAQMLDGRGCCFCGFTWTCRDDVYKREPIAASAGAKDVACKPCWDRGNRL